MPIRRTELADAAAMAEVELGTALTAYAEFFPPDAPPPALDRFVRRWESRVTAGGATAVFCATDDDPADGDDDRIVGTACGQPDPDDPDSGYLTSLYVLPSLWGHGIGRRLHDAVLDHFAAAGLARATLWVIEQNLRSRSMYERWGWRLADGRQEAFGGSGVEEVRYVTAVTATSQRGAGQEVRRGPVRSGS